MRHWSDSRSNRTRKVTPSLSFVECAVVVAALGTAFSRRATRSSSSTELQSTSICVGLSHLRDTECEGQLPLSLQAIPLACFFEVTLKRACCTGSCLLETERISFCHDQCWTRSLFGSQCSSRAACSRSCSLASISFQASPRIGQATNPGPFSVGWSLFFWCRAGQNCGLFVGVGI